MSNNVHQLSSIAQSRPTFCEPMNCSTPGLPVQPQLSEFTQIHVYQVDDTIHPSHPLSSPSPPALNLSQHQGLFQWVSSLHQWPKYWSFSFNISPSNEHPGLISFGKDWLDLLAVQERQMLCKNVVLKSGHRYVLTWCLSQFILSDVRSDKLNF